MPPCACCSIVNRVCFWGPLPQRGWKRPLLLLSVVPFLLGIPALFWFFHAHENVGVLYFLGALLLVMGVLGLLVGLRSCDACVARFAGTL